jgi:hypothetical protein
MNEDEPTFDDTARRLRDAVAAETEPVRVDEAAALDAIRRRAASGRRRRLVGATALGAAAALVIGIAIGAAVGRDDDGHANVASGGPSTTIAGDCASTTTSSTSAPSRTIVEDDGTTYVVPPTTFAEQNAGGDTDVITECADTVPPDTASAGVTSTEPPTTPTSALPTTTIPSGMATVYPFGGVGLSGRTDDDPATVAAAFLDAIGADHPALGAFEQTGPETGTIAVHPRDGNGQVRTDITRSLLRMVRFSGHWTVGSAITDSIDARDARVTSHTLTVSGYGRGFEATLHVQVIGHGDVDFHEGAIAMASGDMELRPFSADIDISGSTGQVATVVISNEGGETGGPSDIVAFTVQLP